MDNEDDVKRLLAGLTLFERMMASKRLLFDTCRSQPRKPSSSINLLNESVSRYGRDAPLAVIQS